MPLFECSACHCVENTAVCNYWSQLVDEKPKICSECDPEIGKWHGKFQKMHVDEYIRQYPQGEREIRHRSARRRILKGEGVLMQIFGWIVGIFIGFIAGQILACEREKCLLCGRKWNHREEV